MAKVHAVSPHVHDTEDDRQLEPTRADRSGIEDDEPLVPPHEWYVGMPAQHEGGPLLLGELGDLGPDLRSVHGDMNHKKGEERSSAIDDLDRDGLRDLRRMHIDVAADGGHGRDLRELVQYGEVPDVPGVKDVVGVLSLDTLRTVGMRMAVRVGDQDERQSIVA